MSIVKWIKASGRRKRIFSEIIVFIVALAITGIGSLIPMDLQEANQVSNDLNQTVTTLSDNGLLLQYIFGNNFLISLLMFIPVLGPLLGFLIMFNTGTVVGAIATSGGYSPAITLASLFLTPIAWLEFAAYSAAMSESIWLLWRFIHGYALRELKNASVLISICAILLAVGAIVETALISLA